ncbi:MAG: acetate/propionate family kinase [Actinomycetota bacterium]
MRVLVVNAGSSSLKLRVLDTDDEIVARHDLPALEGDETKLRNLLEDLSEFDAVGHRVVHGGTRFTEAVRVDAGVLVEIEKLSDLAPLHQPKSLTAIAALERAAPKVPSVACFDTAFHSGMMDAAATYPLPRPWRERWPLRRYGFHGLSHAYASRRAAELTGDDDARVVSCHLGAGASLAAVRAGRSLDTTMGFTPLEGLMMATRSGSVDPGLVLWLQDQAGMGVEELTRALERESGLVGVAGTAEMKAVVEGAERGDDDCRLALDVYVHRLRAGIAAMAAALGGLDVLVFTGGVGENAPRVRAMAAAGLEFLGVALDEGLNERATPDAELTLRDATVRTFVVAAREDIEIARATRRVLGA